MTDIVERLRARPIAWEAADEIGRLRAVAKHLGKLMSTHRDALEAEIRRLKAKLVEADKVCDSYAAENQRFFDRAEATEAKLSKAVEALGRIERIISYPISSEIKERGYDVRTDDDTLSHAVETIRATFKELT